jgi:hypothetical protein
VKEQLALYGTLTGEERTAAPSEERARSAEGARVLPLPRRRRAGRRAEGP